MIRELKNSREITIVTGGLGGLSKGKVIILCLFSFVCNDKRYSLRPKVRAHVPIFAGSLHSEILWLNWGL